MTTKWRPDIKCPYPEYVTDEYSGEKIHNEKFTLWWQAVDATIQDLRTCAKYHPNHEGVYCSPMSGINTLATRVSIPDDPQPKVYTSIWRAHVSYFSNREYWSEFWQPHPASKVVEKGFLCHSCLCWFPYGEHKSWHPPRIFTDGN